VPSEDVVMGKRTKQRTLLRKLACEGSKIEKGPCEAHDILTLTSSSNPNVPRLLPMPPDVDEEIGALDEVGAILSLILSRNDMIRDWGQVGFLRRRRGTEVYGRRGEMLRVSACSMGGVFF